MSYYKHHIFFCLNQRSNGEACCADTGAQAASTIARQVKTAGLAGAGGVRVNKAGCLDRCAGGPVAVVYPDETWYTFVDNARHRRDRRIAPEARPGGRAAAAAAARRPMKPRPMQRVGR
jgi:(2Fe-2S) ferredoxin